ncbi:hypothetical protein IW261DRAFT_1574497 [Armillaria novae-zelandiae]|uniref:Uncharacterized protein n=1 Tax=Armillaria novae-zelandiae TaxID=153914 RepID=A0AA39NJA8_9AGAR|nr:hypothetical protein IW261DRAFT_1574497 [Armillaria novae-zelandiae]
MKKDIPDDDIKNMRKTLTSDIKKFRKRQIKSLSLLETVEFAPTDNAEDDILLLPSDFDIDDHKTYKLEALVKTEYKLREGQANDAIAMLCAGIIHGMVLTDSHRKHSWGVTMNLRSMKYINTVAKKKNEYAASYCQARAALLRLSGVDDLPDFPILRKEDMFSKNAAGAQVLGDGAMTDSWIWTYGRLRGMNEGEKQEFLMDTLRVQWFSTRADTERWMEEVEILEQEFRRFITACKKMEQVWDTIHAENSPVQLWHALNSTEDNLANYQLQISLNDKATCGYRVYAAQKARMYQQMWKKADKDFLAVGGGWPSSEEKLEEYMVEQRPKIRVDWEAQHGDQGNTSKTAAQQGDDSSDSEDNVDDVVLIVEPEQ